MKKIALILFCFLLFISSFNIPVVFYAQSKNEKNETIKNIQIAIDNLPELDADEYNLDQIVSKISPINDKLDEIFNEDKDSLDLTKYNQYKNYISSYLEDEDNIPNVPLSYKDDGLDGSIFLHKKRPLFFSSHLESKYSSIEEGYTTAVKNQNPYGTCWSFAAVASAETNYAKSNNKTKLDLSELQLAWFGLGNYGVQDKINLIKNDGIFYYNDFFNKKYRLDAGGNQFVAMFTLASGIGFSNENYLTYPGYMFYDINDDHCYHFDYSLKSVDIFSMEETDKVKQAIKDYGALAVSYNHYPNNSSSSGFYDYYGENGNSYYHSPDLVGGNHAVTLVGWDDDYSKDNFGYKGKPKPTNNGAWLIKNSWGTNFGDDGYFWISYEEGSLKNSEAYAYTIEKLYPAKDYNYYQYDGGQYPAYLEGDGTDITIANKYAAVRNENITDVGFFTFNAQVNYKIGIYEVPDGKTPFDPSAVLRGEIQTGSLQNAGYHLIKLNTPVDVDAGKNFAVSIELSSLSGNIYIPIDKNNVPLYGDRVNYDEQHTDQCFIKEGSEIYDVVSKFGCTTRIKVLCEKRGAGVSGPVYAVEHYLQNVENDEYEILRDSFTMEGTVGEEVTAEPKIYNGFEYDEFKSSSTKTGIINSDGSLILKLYYKRKTYQLTFNTDGGSTVSPIVGKYGSLITPPNNPVKSGFVFAGWNKNIPNTMPAENMEFTAKWEAEHPGEYVVKFFLEMISTPQNPNLSFLLKETKTYTDKNIGDIVTFSSSTAPEIEGFTLNEQITKLASKLSGIVTSSPKLEFSLYYSRNKYLLNLDKGEGIKNVFGSGEYLYEQGASLYSELEEGYKFRNYTLDGIVITENSDYVYKMPSCDMTLRANASLIDYPINYYLDGGTNNPANPSHYTIKDSDIIIQNPTKDGFIFDGWTTDDILIPTKEIAIPQGSIGDIELKANWIDMTVDLSLLGVEENDAVYIDGSKYLVDGSKSIAINSENDKQLTIYEIENDSETDVHLKYPSHLKTYFFEKEDGHIVAKHKENFDDIMTYEGASIRMTGKKGIRIITSIPTEKKNLLINNNIDGYKVMEYGTVICWADDLESGEEPTLSLDSDGKYKAVHGTKGRAFSRIDNINSIFNESDGISRYTNTLVESSDGQWSNLCGRDFAMRSYIIICPVDSTNADDYVVIYGGTLFRSIAYVAYQNRNTYAPGTDAYEYIWGLIRDGYEDTYDNEYITE